MGGISTVPERKASPHLLGKELPEPPQQKSAWTPPESPLPTNYASATTLLFEQGMADPRGCNYREIEVGTGNVWSGDGGVVRTHGWVLPGKGEQRFAVCWNGLVYPAVSVGEPADLRADVRAAAQKTGRRWQNALPEGFTLAHETCLPIKGCLLFRLGEAGLARQMWVAIQLGSQKGFDAGPGATLAELDQVKLGDADPYLNWASDWAWGLFERAVCAHMRGDDGLSLASARLLASARPKIESSAEQRGFKRQRTYNSPWDGKYQDYLDFLGPLPTLLADQERRAQRREPQLTLADITRITNQAARVSALVDQMDQIAVRQMSQPGGIGFSGGFPERESVLTAVLKEGQPAVEPLLQCLESECAGRLTRSVSFGRDFHRGRYLHPVSEPAVSLLHGILGAGNFGVWATTNEIARAGTNGNRVTAAQIRAWMRQFFGKTPEERWYITLLNDTAGMDLWIDAADNIAKPVRSGTATNATTLQGESLRTKSNPTVSELLEKRIRATGGGIDFYGGPRSAGFALTFARWDSNAALPVLSWQMDNARKALDSTDYTFWNYGQESYLGILIGHTLARIQYGDTNALKEYAEWLGSRKPGQAFIAERALMGSNGARLDQLKPAWMFPDDPAIVAALDKLLGDPDSPWRPALAGTNGTIGLVDQLAATPLLVREVVRQYMLVGLVEKAHAGVVTFGPSPFRTNDISVDCSFDVGWGSGGTAKRTEKLPEDLASPMPFRVCDLFAEQLASVDGFPPFEKYWSLKERDQAINAIIKFINENRGELASMAAKKRKREWWKHQ
jgi:hypothetical protein